MADLWLCRGWVERGRGLQTALQCQPGVCVVPIHVYVCDACVCTFVCVHRCAIMCSCVHTRMCTLLNCVSLFSRWVCVSVEFGFLWVDVCKCIFPRCLPVCESFMVTDSIHLSRPFTVKRQLLVKSSLDSFSSSPTTAAIDSSTQESSPWVHTLFNQPTTHQNPLWVSKRSCKTSRSTGLNICPGNEQDLVKMQPS